MKWMTFDDWYIKNYGPLEDPDDHDYVNADTFQEYFESYLDKLEIEAAEEEDIYIENEGEASDSGISFCDADDNWSSYIPIDEVIAAEIDMSNASESAEDYKKLFKRYMREAIIEE